MNGSFHDGPVDVARPEALHHPLAVALCEWEQHLKQLLACRIIVLLQRVNGDIGCRNNSLPYFDLVFRVKVALEILNGLFKWHRYNIVDREPNVLNAHKECCGQIVMPYWAFFQIFKPNFLDLDWQFHAEQGHIFVDRNAYLHAISSLLFDLRYAAHDEPGSDSPLTGNLESFREHVKTLDEKDADKLRYTYDTLWRLPDVKPLIAAHKLEPSDTGERNASLLEDATHTYCAGKLTSSTLETLLIGGLHDALWQLFENGRKPTLRPQRYSVQRMLDKPSPVPRSAELQERITLETEHLLLSAAGVAKKRARKRGA